MESIAPAIEFKLSGVINWFIIFPNKLLKSLLLFAGPLALFCTFGALLLDMFVLFTSFLSFTFEFELFSFGFCSSCFTFSSFLSFSLLLVLALVLLF
jgi:hypothetical protein